MFLIPALVFYSIPVASQSLYLYTNGHLQHSINENLTNLTSFKNVALKIQRCILQTSLLYYFLCKHYSIALYNLHNIHTCMQLLPQFYAAR